MRACSRGWLALLGMMVTLSARAAYGGGAAPTTMVDPDTEIARRHFDRGTAFYGEGRYAQAIIEFEAAKKVKPLPDFDFNIGGATTA